MRVRSEYDFDRDNSSFMLHWVQREPVQGPAFFFCCIHEAFCLFVVEEWEISYPTLYEYKLTILLFSQTDIEERT